MITLEKDLKAEEILIHAAPEDLREFAKELWAISQKAETSGKYKQELTASSSEDAWLSPTLKGTPKEHSVITKLTIFCQGT